MYHLINKIISFNKQLKTKLKTHKDIKTWLLFIDCIKQITTKLIKIKYQKSVENQLKKLSGNKKKLLKKFANKLY